MPNVCILLHTSFTSSTITNLFTHALRRVHVLFTSPSSIISDIVISKVVEVSLHLFTILLKCPIHLSTFSFPLWHPYHRTEDDFVNPSKRFHFDSVHLSYTILLYSLWYWYIIKSKKYWNIVCLNWVGSYWTILNNGFTVWILQYLWGTRAIKCVFKKYKYNIR